MRQFRIKIVPDYDPDAEGEWKDITQAVKRDMIQDRPVRFPASSWQDQVAFLKRYCPPGFHIVAIGGTE